MRSSVRAMGGGLVVALALSACGVLPGDEGDESSAEPSGTVLVGGCQPQNPLVPAMTEQVCARNPLESMFSMLVRHDPETGEVVNEIAEAITSEDHLTWQVEIEPGWTFHDGTPVDANSFVDAWNWAAHGSNAALSHNSDLFSIIEGYEDVQGETDADGNFVPGTAEDTMSGIEVIDETTFEVTIKQPQPGFPHRLGHVAFAPLPTAFFGSSPEEFAASPIGSGPFQFAERDEGRSITLEAYEGYQGDVQPKVGGVTYEMFDNADAEYASLLADQVDVMTQLPTSALTGEEYMSELGERYVEKDTGVLHMLGFPPEESDPSLADPRVRQAIAMAIDRQLIVDNVFQGARDVATGWVSPGVEGYLEDQCGEFCTLDAERARDMLAETGFDGELTISYTADGGNEDAAVATCNSLANVLEVPCTPKQMDTRADLVDTIRSGDMSGMFWTTREMEYPSNESFLIPLYTTDAEGNLFGHSNEQFDNLIDEAASHSHNQSHGQAVSLFQEAERLLVQQMPTIPMWHGLTVAGYSTRVANVALTPFGTVDPLSLSLQ